MRGGVGRNGLSVSNVVVDLVAFCLLMTGCSASRCDLCDKPYMVDSLEHIKKQHEEIEARYRQEEQELEWWRKEAHERQPGSIHVRASGTVWDYKHPPLTGAGHGDGVARLTIRGRVVTGSEERPTNLADVDIIELPIGQFGGVDEPTVKQTTSADGRFQVEIEVGAAFTLGGKTPGAMYSSGKAKLCIRRAGYEPLVIRVGYGCPELVIHLREEAKNTLPLPEE